MAGKEMLAVIRGLAHHSKKDVCLTFSSGLSEPRKFEKKCSEEDSGGRLPIVYIHMAQVYPFVWRGSLCAILYIPAWRRHLLLLNLDIEGNFHLLLSQSDIE